MGWVFGVEVRLNAVHVIYIVEPMGTINAVHVIDINKSMSSIDAVDVVNTVDSMGTIKAVDAISGAILLEETYWYNTLLEGERGDRWVVGARSSERFADCRVLVRRIDQNALNGGIRN